MTTEKMRVSASSVIKSDPETSATPARVRRDGDAVGIIGESLPFSGATLARSN
jgi:hypothetical protein